MIRPLLASILAAALLLVTACGAQTVDDPAPAPAGAGYPVTVSHALGAAEIPAAPARVVTLSSGDTDAALALGVTPVAVVTPFYAPGPELPWQAGRLGPEVTAIPGNPDFSVDVEAVAAARPDLVLGTGAMLTPQTYQALTRIAPVVAHLGSPTTDRWQDLTAAVGTALGRGDAAGTAIGETTAAIAAFGDRHPGLRGRTFTFSVLQSPTTLGTVVSGTDHLSVLFGELGLRLPDAVAGRPESAPGTGIAAVSTEQLGDLAADLVLVVAPSPELAESFGTDPRVAGLGSVRTLDMITATALRTPSALSLRWGLEQLEPLPAAAG